MSKDISGFHNSACLKQAWDKISNKQVLIVLDSQLFGGIESHVLHLSQLLQSKQVDHCVCIWQGYSHQPICQRLDRLNLPYCVLNGKLNSLLTLLSANPKAVIHTHGYKAGIIARFCSLVNHHRCVSTFHAGEINQGKLGWYQRLDNWTSFLSTNIAVSSAIDNALPFNSKVMNNFIAINSGSKKDSTHADINSTESSTKNSVIKVGFVGRLSYEKGPDLFLQLAKRYHQAALNKQTVLNKQTIEFVMVGEGPMQRELQPLYQAYARFEGFQLDMAPTWQQLDCLMLTSRAEGLPMTAIEAMHAGVNVIATPVGNLPKLLTNQCGWLSQTTSLDDIAQSFESWLQASQQQKHQVAQAAKQKAQNEYGGEQAFTALDQIYWPAIS